MKAKEIGRPTMYKDNYAQDLLDFFSLDEPSYKERTNNQGSVQMVARRMATFERFANEIGVDTSTLYRWSTATKNNSDEPLHPEFCIAYARAKDCQMAYILEAGVVGALNSSFLNLFVKNAHGWQDKTEQEVSHSSTIDMSEVDADLRLAAEDRARKTRELEEQGLTGRFET